MRIFLVSAALIGLTVGCGSRQLSADGSESTSAEQGDETTSEAEEGGEADAGSSSTSADTGESESESEGEGESDEGMTFVDMPDMWPDEGCTVFDQNCPEGEKCVPSTQPGPGIYRCVPILGDQGVGEACVFDGPVTGGDDCDASSHCWDLQETDEGEVVGTCIPLCQGSPDDAWCPNQGESCFAYQCVFFGQVGIPLCAKPCDPIGQDCPAGLGCYYTGVYTEFQCAMETENVQLGEPCDYINDCAPGLNCTPAELVPGCAGESCCMPYCEVGVDAPCEAALPGSQCLDVGLELPARGCPQFGACGVTN